MKNLKTGKEILIIVVVLTSIAMLSGLLLGVMNKVTYVDPTEALRERIGKLYDSPIETVDISDYQNISDTEILNAFVAEDGAYIIEAKSKKAYSSKGLKLIVIIKDGESISINGQGNSETPGLGSKALAVGYLNRYIGLPTTYFGADEDTNEEVGSGIKLLWGFQDYSTPTNTGVSEGINSDSGEVEAISGATKSSVGVKNAVKAAFAFYNYMEGENE